MHQLPKINESVMPDEQQKALFRWLHEWYLDQQLQEEPVPEAATGSGVPDVNLRPVDTAAFVGQIRLMHPQVIVQQARPLYFALLEERPKARYLVAPFSRFSEPATPFELYTEHDSAVLKVLCLWNSRVWPRSLVQQSWIVDELSDSDLDAACAVWRFCRYRETPPQETTHRCGPPLIHPEDPRWKYMAEEDKQLSQIGEPDKGEVIPFEYTQTGQELPCAAESSESYGSTLYQISGMNCRVKVMWDECSQCLMGQIKDTQGEPCTKLDGTAVEVQDPVRSVQVVNGCFKWPFPIHPNTFIIHLHDGKKVTAEKV